MLVLLLVVAAVSASGWYGYSYLDDRAAGIKQEDLITATVCVGPFDHIVIEQGEIESSSNIEVICEVEARGGSGTPILWVIDEGTRVSKGDKLVELDASQLEVTLKDNRIQVITAESALASANALLEQATIARQEYLEGVYKTEEKAIQSEIAIAEQELRKAQLALESSERLVAKGLVKSLQLDADRYSVANASNQLESAKGRLTVLQELTRKKMLVQFDSDINAAKADVAAKQSSFEEERQELLDVQEQIANCVIYAPADGVVVHANRYSRRGGDSEFVVEAGATVRERQAIIRLPDPTRMQVKCKVNESRITLIEPGMPARIAIDAIVGMELRGVVVKVNRYAEPGSWYSSSIKEYAVWIEIIDPPDNIRTGMTAEAQIFVEQLDDAIQIPIQGLYEHGGEMYSLVQKGPQTFETRKVKVDATNDAMASITDGVEEDESIVLNLRSHLSLLDLPELDQVDNSDMRDISERMRNETGDGENSLRTDLEASIANADPSMVEKMESRIRSDGNPDGSSGAALGGMPNPAAIAGLSMDLYDTDSDGMISTTEIDAIDDPNRRDSMSAADTNGDGNVSRAELIEAIRKRTGNASGGPGGRGGGERS
ncbi:HlyD family efflux transporter periplasmic adaptor subunit [Novipirellula aureliae]|uniref:HlyD family efflux transporter periplasmic adaptor subunit n=1 Tax=Novipirellula aureliae TaxID=2527966 RepID=UPI0036F1ADA1